MAKGFVLLVDDESLVRSVMSRALREAGYSVAEATNGDEALELARKMRFDAIVTDSHMPGISGAALLDQLRQEWEADLGSTAPADVVMYCGSGVTACHNLLALEVAGLSGARIFPGSWSEWSANPNRPVER